MALEDQVAQLSQNVGNLVKLVSTQWENVVIDRTHTIHISSNGNVGIGNTSPSSKLSVAGRISTLNNNYFEALGSVCGGFDEYGESPIFYGAYNSLAFITNEGGSVSFSPDPTSGNASYLFDGTGNWVYWRNPSEDISITIDLPYTLNTIREFIIHFVSSYYPTSFTIELFNSNSNSWVLFDNVTNWNKNYYAKKMGNLGYNIDKVRITMHSYNSSDYVMISEIIMTRYSLPSMNYFLYRGGGQNVYGGVNLATDYGNVGIGTRTPNSTLHINGSLSLPITTKSANYTVSASDYIILGNASSGSITFTLPTAVGIAGRIYEFVKIDSSSNTITIDGAGSETINGALTKVLSTQWQRCRIVSNGVNWIILSE
jgi:hypothetical protein